MKIIDRKFLDVPTPTCHAATIAFHENKPVFSWFGGKKEGLPDSSIYLQYGDASMLAFSGNVAHWNPILFKVEDELFLSYKKGIFCDRWQTYIVNITDAKSIDDINQIEQQIIAAGLNFCVKTKPIVDGFNIYCGSSVETSWDWTSYIETYVYEDNKFEYVSRSRPLTVDKKEHEFEHPYYGKVKQLTMGIIQPSLWFDKYKAFHAFFRSSRGLGKIYHSIADMDSWSDTEEWTDPSPTKFENPNSGVDTVYFDGRLFLVYNPSKQKRSPLVISELDHKLNVVDELLIQEKVELPTRPPHSLELSYPYIIEHGGELHLVYTHARTKLKYVTIGI